MKTKLDRLLLALFNDCKIGVNEMVVISSAVYAWEPPAAIYTPYAEAKKRLIAEEDT